MRSVRVVLLSLAALLLSCNIVGFAQEAISDLDCLEQAFFSSPSVLFTSRKSEKKEILESANRYFSEGQEQLKLRHYAVAGNSFEKSADILEKTLEFPALECISNYWSGYCFQLARDHSKAAIKYELAEGNIRRGFMGFDCDNATRAIIVVAWKLGDYFKNQKKYADAQYCYLEAYDKLNLLNVPLVLKHQTFENDLDFLINSVEPEIEASRKELIRALELNKILLPDWVRVSRTVQSRRDEEQQSTLEFAKQTALSTKESLIATHLAELCPPMRNPKRYWDRINSLCEEGKLGIDAEPIACTNLIDLAAYCINQNDIDSARNYAAKLKKRVMKNPRSAMNYLSSLATCFLEVGFEDSESILGRV